MPVAKLAPASAGARTTWAPRWFDVAWAVHERIVVAVVGFGIGALAAASSGLVPGVRSC